MDARLITAGFFIIILIKTNCIMNNTTYTKGSSPPSENFESRIRYSQRRVENSNDKNSVENHHSPENKGIFHFTWDEYKMHMEVMRRNLSLGFDPELGLTYLQNQGLSHEDAILFLERAVVKGPMTFEEEVMTIENSKSDEYGCGAITIISLLLSIIKLLMSL